MNTEQLERDLAPVVQTVRVIVGALLLSVIGVTVMMVFLRRQGGDGWNFSEGSIVTLTGLAFAIGAPLLATVISRQTVTTTRRKMASGEISPPEGGAKRSTKVSAREADIESLAMLYQTKTIVLVAVLEGAAFFCAIAFMIEGDLLTVIAAGLLAIGIASQFPTSLRVVNFVENQLRTLDEERALRAEYQAMVAARQTPPRT